jgi:hypothetical protein
MLRMPIMKVRMPSRRKSQNQPGLPPTPRIWSIPAARRLEMTRAICDGVNILFWL